MSPERNLLFGLLALQNGFISRDQLVAAFGSWTADKSQPLDQILRSHGAITPAKHDLLSALVAEHLAQHGNDPQQSLAALSSIGDARQALASIADADVQASLHSLGTFPPKSPDEFATIPTPASAPAGDGRRFRVLRPHARGGLGEVFVAVDTELHREVALKQIQSQFSGDQANRDRFVREAEITGGLEHPSIVPVYGLGTYADGRPFYAMKFIRGDSLKEAIEAYHKPGGTSGEKSLALRQLLQRFIDICEAMQYAHDRGVLHRDLKPGNIMLGRYGETLVVDWGLAKPLGKNEESSPEKTLIPASSGSGETLPGSAVGTPAYMSPEQAAGNLNDLGPTSDIYSLGATLYHILTGVPPFTGQVNDVLNQVTHGRFPKPREKNGQIPRALEAICIKAMALKPADRYATAKALAADVEHWLADEPVSIVAETVSDKLSRVGRKHRGLVTAVLAASVLIALGSTLAAVVINMQRQANAELAVHNAKLALSEQQEKDKAQKLAVEKEGLANREREQREKSDRLSRANKQLAQTAEERRQAAEKLAETERELRKESERLAMENEQLAEQEKKERAKAVASAKAAEQEREKAVNFSKLEREQRNKSDRLAMENQNLAMQEKQQRVAAQELAKKNAEIAAEKTKLSEELSIEVKRAIAAESDARRKLYATQIAQASLEIASHSHHAAKLTLETIPWDQRSWEYYYLWRQCEGTPLSLGGHSKIVTSVSFSPDGKRLASGSHDATIKIWDAQTGAELQTLRGHLKEITSVSFSPDGKRLASGSDDATVIIWDAQTGAQQQALRGHLKEISSVSFSPDGKRLATGSHDTTIKLWDALNGAEIRTLRGHTAKVNSVCFSPDGKRLASGSGDSTVKLWDTLNGIVFRTYQQDPKEDLRGDAKGVSSVSFSPDGSKLFSGSFYFFKSWDAQTGAELLSIAGENRRVYCVTFSPDGQRVACSCLDNSYKPTIKLLDAKTGAEIRSIYGQGSVFSGLSFSPDGMRLAAANGETVKLWDSFDEPGLQTIKASNHAATFVTFSPDGTRFATACSVSGPRDYSPIVIWDGKTGMELHNISKYTAQVNSVSFSPDGKLLASGAHDSIVKLWDTQKGTDILTLNGHAGSITSLSFNPDGSHLASASEDQTIKFWNVRTGAELRTLRGHTAKINSVIFSPDGKQLASGSHDKTVKLWDTQTGVELRTLDGHSVVSFSPDGKRLAGGSSGNLIKLWDALTGAELQSFSVEAQSICFSPDWKRFVTTNGNAIQLWDTETGAVVQTLHEKDRIFDSVSFSPDGCRLVSVSDKFRIKLRDARIQDEMQILRGHSRQVASVRFKLDGTTIVSQDVQSNMLIWRLPNGELDVVDSVPDEENLTIDSPDPNLRTVIRGNDIELIRRNSHYDPWADDAERRWKRESQRHSNYAQYAEFANDWYAAAFHLGWSLRDQPNDAAIKHRYDQALAKLKEHNITPPKLPVESSPQESK